MSQVRSNAVVLLEESFGITLRQHYPRCCYAKKNHESRWAWCHKFEIRFLKKPVLNINSKKQKNTAYI